MRSAIMERQAHGKLVALCPGRHAFAGFANRQSEWDVGRPSKLKSQQVSKFADVARSQMHWSTLARAGSSVRSARHRAFQAPAAFVNNIEKGRAGRFRATTASCYR